MNKSVESHSFNIYLLSAYCVPGTVVDTRDSVMNKTDKNP